MNRTTLIKWSVGFLMFATLAFAILILFSPYGAKKDYIQKAIVVETNIDASSSEVFKYLGNSEHASKWSTFVSKVKSINLVRDGEVGSKRRCFGKEKGIVWDEEILLCQENKKRLLNVYNAKGFPMMADDLLTEQVYEPLTENKTRLKLSLFFKEGKRNFLSEIKMYFAAYVIADIFKNNLTNIKRFNEQAKS